MKGFAGKTAVITGAASGIGYALTRELSRLGAIVYAADRNVAGLASLREDCAAASVVSCRLDVTDEGAVKALLERVVAEQGQLDFLFNNAGIVVGGDFEHMNAAAWQQIVDINLWGVVYGSQHGYALMLRQGHGHIINTASTAGVVPVARSTAYAATKHAVVGLSVSLREEARAHGIRISVAIPGLVDTNIFRTATGLNGHDYAAAIGKVPIRKIAPEQAAKAMLSGVARNRQYIIFPGYNRLIVGLSRVMPGLVGRLINR
jgi:NADP-dependent 3-hydroxy acid dehydrogenase YdfG